MKSAAEYMREYRARQFAVYVVWSNSGASKIGYSGSLKNRLRALRAEFPDQELTMVFSQPLADQKLARIVEGHAQWLLRDKHFFGEWFSVPHTEAIEAIKRAVIAVSEGARERFRYAPIGTNRIICSVRFEPDEVALIDSARSQSGATRQSWLHAAAMAYSTKAQVEARKPIQQSEIERAQRDLGKPLASVPFGPQRPKAGERQKDKRQ